MTIRAVDLFAGWGGFTLGAHQAGVDVVYAANHWQLAVDVHQVNHPDAEHVCQDLRQADWSELPEYKLLLASPSCKGHSTASRGHRRAYHDALRQTAWAVLDCAEDTAPETVLVENVPWFQRWVMYDLFLEGFRRLGYTVTTTLSWATAHGVPQRRRRLFICASRVGASLAPDPGILEEPPIGPCIEWEAPGWRPWSAGSAGHQARMAKGRRNHGERFLSQHVTGHPGVPLHEPMRTMTTKDQWTVVRGDQYRPLTLREHARGMGVPDSYWFPEDVSRGQVIAGFGNMVCPPPSGRYRAAGGVRWKRRKLSCCT